MGNWHISIEGVGCHHNDNYLQDANKMAAKFVSDLCAAGHRITKASFTFGDALDLNDDKSKTNDIIDGENENGK